MGWMLIELCTAFDFTEEQQSLDDAGGIVMGSQFAASPPPAPAVVPPPSQTWGTSNSSNPWSGHKSSLIRRQVTYCGL
jgi:hypothetical protein